MRLIDADSLTEELASLRVTIIGLRYGKGVLDAHMNEYRKSFLRIVDEQATVDAVEVVRCKDCEFGRQPWLEGQTLVKCMKGITKLVDPMHFCGYGERKENG